MEFIINSKYFNEALSDVSKIITTKSLLPILSGIKITAQQDCLILVGSNSNIVIERIIPLEINGVHILQVIKPGNVVLPAKYLCSIAKKLPSEIHIKKNSNHAATIQSEDIMVQLNGFSSNQYPNHPSINTEPVVQIPSQILMEVIKQTTFAVSKSETRPILSGVNISCTDHTLTFVATNSHRLALRKLPIQSQIHASFTVPATSLIELTKLLNNEESLIQLYLTNSFIVFKSSSFSLFSRIIEGNYPGISKIIPTDLKTVIILDTVRLLKGIDRACLFAGDWKNNNVSLEIIKGEHLKISSSSTEIGKTEELLDICMVQGDKELNIFLDGEFMLDALRAIKEREIKLCFGGPLKPVLIEPVNNSSNLHLISPVRS